MLEVAVGVLGTGLLGVFGWAFTQIGKLDIRVAVLEADKASLKELLQVQLSAIERRLNRIEDTLEEIKVKEH